MSNDTQVLRATLETALARIEDMLADDDGQAFKEARKFLESARQLSEQPGFVMVPVEPTWAMAGEFFDELEGGPDWGETPDDDEDKLEAFAEFSKGYRAMLAARPLTASPTAPTEASEPVGDGTLCGHCDGSGTVLAVTGHLGPDDYEYEAQCEACWGTGSSDLRDAINALSYQPHSVTPGRQMVHRADVLRIIAARTTPPPAPVLSDENHELIKLAAWLLSPEPTRQIDRLEDQTHIGHRQFESAQEAMRETLRNKAVEIRKFVDAGRASRGAK